MPRVRKRKASALEPINQAEEWLMEGGLPEFIKRQNALIPRMGRYLQDLSKACDDVHTLNKKDRAVWEEYKIQTQKQVNQLDDMKRDVLKAQGKIMALQARVWQVQGLRPDDTARLITICLQLGQIAGQHETILYMVKHVRDLWWNYHARAVAQLELLPAPAPPPPRNSM